MSDVLATKDILAILAANKKKPVNYACAIRRVEGKRHTNNHKDCGKLKGYCKNCGLMVGEADLLGLETDACPRCGQKLKVTELTKTGKPCTEYGLRAAWGNAEIPADYLLSHNNRGHYDG